MFTSLLRTDERPADQLRQAPRAIALLGLIVAATTYELGLSVFLLAALAIPFAEALARYRIGVRPGSAAAYSIIVVELLAHSFFLAKLQVTGPGIAHRFLVNVQYASVLLLAVYGSVLLLRKHVLAEHIGSASEAPDGRIPGA